MKKILIINCSPRKKGNCSALSQIMANEIKTQGAEAAIYSLSSMDINYCLGCYTCKKYDYPSCVHKDDFTAMMTEIAECDGFVFVSPVYFSQVPGPAKIFIDRMYSFWNPFVDTPLIKLKETKKTAIVMTSNLAHGDPKKLEPLADWVGYCFETVGSTENKNLIQNGLNDLWDSEDEKRIIMAEQAKELAKWVLS